MKRRPGKQDIVPDVHAQASEFSPSPILPRELDPPFRGSSQIQ
jgi:hypothetical protein